MTIDVTQADIDEGEPENPWMCPVALAIKRAIGRPRNGECVDVCSGTIMVYTRGVPRSFRTSDEVYNFVKCFDALSGEDAKPFSFEVPL